MLCARPGTVGAQFRLSPADRRIAPIRASGDRDDTAAADAKAARAAAEQAAADAKAAAEQVAAAQMDGQQLDQTQQQLPPQEPTSAWGDTFATVVGAAAPTILAGVVLYYLTRTPQA